MLLFVTHVVVGALGMVTMNLQRSLQETLVSLRTEFLQNAALIGTARILRKVLEPEAKGGRLPLIE